MIPHSVFFSVFLCILSSCASKTPTQESKVHKGAAGMDLFEAGSGMPVREVRKQDFYFKRCELEGRHAFTSKIEYSCSANPLAD